MPIDKGFSDSFSSAFLDNMNSSFSLDKISSPPQLNSSMGRKRKYVEDQNEEACSNLASRIVGCRTYQGQKPDEKTDFLQIPTESKRSKTDQAITTSPEKNGVRPLDEDRAVPSDAGTKAVTSEVRDREELTSILNNLPNRGTVDDDDRKDAVSYSLLPMKNFVEDLAEKLKDGIVQDWSPVFSKMELFESANLERLDQILTTALAYEAKLKNEKEELRNFLAKLSDVFQHD